MNQKTLERLEHLRKRNRNRQWQNRDLYRLMYQEDWYILAYERLKSKPGNMTAGSDGETLDGFSLKQIQRIIQEMRTEQFQFKPVRTVYIPKPNGKMRKLGIPSIRDKVVHKVMHMILEAIYDSPYGAYFLPTSHGFRPNRSCHTALREYRTQWSATNWLIEGDIHACFDELAHEVLVHLLRKKITDERFLNLIWKLLQAGYMDVHGARKDSLIGSPQGGIVSPILANVYLHELDEFVEQLRHRLEQGKKKRGNPVYFRLARKKRRLEKQGLTKTKRFRELVKHIRTHPTVLVNDPNFVRVRYLRYADDWMIGVCGSKRLAESIKEEVKRFLRDTLKLQLSEEKTRITNAKSEEAAFLGTTLKIGHGGTPKVVLTTNGRETLQTALHRMGNSHARPASQTHEETARERLLYGRGEAYRQTRMVGRSIWIKSCCFTAESIAASRTTTVSRTTGHGSPVSSTSSSTRSLKPWRSSSNARSRRSSRALAGTCASSSKGRGETGPAGSLLPQPRLEQTPGGIPSRKPNGY